MAQRKRSKSNQRKAVYIETLESRIAPAALTVTTLHDSGPGSLRQAIMDANSAAGADTIDFHHGLHGTIKLTTDLPAVTDAVTITGPGASKLIVNGHRHQIISVTGTNVDVTISGVTLTGGQAVSGGGVSVDDAGGTVTLSKTTVSKNFATSPSGPSATAGMGGGIAVAAGTVKLQDSKVTGNKAGIFVTKSIYNPHTERTKTVTTFVVDGTGGGIDVGAAGTVDVQGSVISGNFSADGGGIHNAGALIVEQISTISKNRAEAFSSASTATGGGISNVGGGTVAVTDSKISGNRAIGTKGVIYGPGGITTGVGGAAKGGGIFNAAEGNVSVVNSIISGNQAIGGKGAKGFRGNAGANSYTGRGGKGGVGGPGGTGGAAAAGAVFNDGTLTVQTSKITGNSALAGRGGSGGTGGGGGQGVPAAPAYIYHGHIRYAATPPGPGGFGGAGGPGGAGGIATEGGVFDSTATVDLTGSTISGNKQINGKKGAKGAAGAMGRPGSSGGGNPYI